MNKKETRIRRTKKLRASLKKKESLRLCVSRSLKNISVQLIDSNNGAVLASASTIRKNLKEKTEEILTLLKKLAKQLRLKQLN